ncbi:hypothetical protein PATSB16_30240 [Pandoraea thiooxydans]|nr:hypothetical protein PATSB16_30240 [Pandoraea thiooxydans]
MVHMTDRHGSRTRRDGNCSADAPRNGGGRDGNAIVRPDCSHRAPIADRPAVA